MSAFKIGQRVRLARPLKPEFLGQEGVITDFDSAPKGTMPGTGRRLTIDCNCGVAWDKNDGAVSWQHTDQLEPILYDGNQLVEWSECLWQPEGQAA
jgi:hypothetical protein